MAGLEKEKAAQGGLFAFTSPALAVVGHNTLTAAEKPLVKSTGSARNKRSWNRANIWFQSSAANAMAYLFNKGRVKQDLDPRANLIWTMLAVVAFVAAAGLPLTGHGIATDNLELSSLGFVGLLLPLALPRYRNDPRISKTIVGATLLLSFTAAGTVLSYLVVATNAPLVDATLAAWDRALGFDWMSYCNLIQSRPWLMTSLEVAYDSGLPQLIVVVIFLGISRRHARMEEFLRLYFLTALIVIAISGPFPAEGPWKYYGADPTIFDVASQSHFELLRDGRMLDIPIGRATQGLVSMPSLHAATAIVLIYAMRQTVLFPVFVMLNLAMLISTPVMGSHYLVDVIAGVVLAVGLIMIDRHSV